MTALSAGLWQLSRRCCCESCPSAPYWALVSLEALYWANAPANGSWRGISPALMRGSTTRPAPAAAGSDKRSRSRRSTTAGRSRSYRRTAESRSRRESYNGAGAAGARPPGGVGAAGPWPPGVTRTEPEPPEHGLRGNSTGCNLIEHSQTHTTNGELRCPSSEHSWR